MLLLSFEVRGVVVLETIPKVSPTHTPVFVLGTLSAPSYLSKQTLYLHIALLGTGTIC